MPHSLKWPLTFLGIALLAACISLGWQGLVLAWLAFSFLRLAWSTRGKDLFRKQAGRIPLSQKLLHTPYLAVTQLTWHFWRWTSQEGPWVALDSQLNLGRRLLDSEPRPEVDFWVDLTNEFDEPQDLRQSPNYRSFPIADASTPQIDELLALLQEISSGRIYLHCAQGHGRTGLVAAAYLLYTKKANDVDAALQFLRRHRPGIRLNTQQGRFLLEHQNTLLSSRPNTAGGTPAIQ